MRRITLIFALLLSLMGVRQANAETITEDFESVQLTDKDGNVLTTSYACEAHALINGVNPC